MQKTILDHPDEPELWDLDGFLRRGNHRREDIFTTEFLAKMEQRRREARAQWESELAILSSPGAYHPLVFLDELFRRTRPEEGDMVLLRTLFDKYGGDAEEDRLKVIAWILARFGTPEDSARVAQAATSENGALRRAALHGIRVGKGSEAVVEFVAPRVNAASWPLNERVAFLESISAGLEGLRTTTAGRSGDDARHQDALRVLTTTKGSIDTLRRAALISPEPFERSEAAGLFDLTNEQDRREYLDLLAGNPDGILTYHLVGILGRGQNTRNPSVRSLAFSLVNHANTAVRSGLVEVLENWGTGSGPEGERAREALQAMTTSDSEEGVRKAAGEALARIAEERAEIDENR